MRGELNHGRWCTRHRVFFFLKRPEKSRTLFNQIKELNNDHI
jgi:hypothetical protein